MKYITAAKTLPGLIRVEVRTSNATKLILLIFLFQCNQQ